MQGLLATPGLVINGAIAVLVFAVLAYRISGELRAGASGHDSRDEDARFYVNFMLGCLFVASLLAAREFTSGQHWRSPDQAAGPLQRLAANPAKLALFAAIAVAVIGGAIVLWKRRSARN